MCTNIQRLGASVLIAILPACGGELTPTEETAVVQSALGTSARLAAEPSSCISIPIARTPSSSPSGC
jgi:hypothetical protein